MKCLSRAAACTAILLVCHAGRAAHAAPSYTAIVQGWVDAEAASHPVAATALGLHQGDARMDAVSPEFHASEVKRLHATLTQLAALPAPGLTAAQRNDRDILAAEIGGELLEEEHVQQWRHNPDTYVSLVTNGPYFLIARDFAPAAARLRDAIAREAAIPAIFAAAKQNLTAMPPVFIDIALEDVDGAATFLGHDLPDAFASVKDATAQAALKSSTQKAVAACQDFASWLHAQKPGAHGSFVLGAANYRLLLDADLIDLTPDQVLAAGRAQLQKDRTDFLAAARIVDPAKPADALALVGADHPDGAHLISTAHDQLAMLQEFIKAHHIIDLPGQDLPKVAETPPFQRAIVFGEMDPPGPFETHATQAYYYITPPDTTKSHAEQEEYLAYFNNALLLNLGVHEALPGHFTQYLYLRANPDWSLVRKTGHSYTATEGWAHYTEQMMQQQGLLDRSPKLHLAQLQDALLRDCRLVASVEMHTHGMSLADAAKMMADTCFQPPPVAYKEARRGTSDPGYFSYTLGKLMILKLRADVQAKEGPAFTLAHFHDRFLNAGLVPLKIIRREIMDRMARCYEWTHLMNIAHLCVLVAGALPYVTVGGAKARSGYDNAAPRKYLSGLDGWRARANWAHQNHFEAFAPFAAGVVLAELAHANQARIDTLAVIFVALRIAYTFIYIADVATVRSLIWAGGVACVAWLLLLSL